MTDAEITGFYADEDGINFILIDIKNFRLICRLTTDAVERCLGSKNETIEETFTANKRVITKATLEKFAEMQAKGVGCTGPLIIDSEWLKKYEVLAGAYRADSNARLGRSNAIYERLLSERLRESSLWLALETAHQQFLRDGSAPPAQLLRDWTEIRESTNSRFEEFFLALSKP